MDTPRCLFTGAERFLEIAEEIDQDNTGLLHEDGGLSLNYILMTNDILTNVLHRLHRILTDSIEMWCRHLDLLIEWDAIAISSISREVYPLFGISSVRDFPLLFSSQFLVFANSH